MANMRALLPLIVNNALNVLGAVVILLIGLWLSGKAEPARGQDAQPGAASRRDAEELFGSLARYLVLTVTVLAVLSQFGIQTTSLVAVIGVAEPEAQSTVD
jgi:small conductance mechanosensitive channel